MKRWAWLLAVPLLASCSQVAALQQVSGVPLATVEIAAADVLVAKDVPLLQAPNCTETETEFNCSGTTVAGKPIVVTVPNDEQQVMTITVDGEQIFSGPVQDVIEESGERLP
jgi:hypothetical protein